MDTHPIHLHLTQFQLVSRQKMDTMQYAMDWANQNAALSMMGDGMPPWSSEPTPLDVTNYLTPNTLTGPDPNEQGWKDTVRMNPGEVTRIRVRFAPIGGDVPVRPDRRAGVCLALPHHRSRGQRYDAAVPGGERELIPRPLVLFLSAGSPRY
jgi:spore coat protein A